MKIHFGVSAGHLRGRVRARDGVYATLSHNDVEFGRTEVIEESGQPYWKKVFVLDCDNVDEANVIVGVFLTENDTELGRAQFSVAELLGHRSKVLHEDIEGGGTVFIHAAEYASERSSFKFQIHGKDLVNVSRAQLFGSKSDPYFEVESASGDIVYKSEVKNNNLEPDWSVAEVGLHSLCNDDFDALCKLVFFDHDPGENPKLMGTFQISVNDLLVAAARGESVVMSKEGVTSGQILVLQAECVGLVTASKLLKAAASAKELVEATAMVASSKAQAVLLVKEDLDKAREHSAARKNSDAMASAALADALQVAGVATALSMEAAGEAERIRKDGLFGTLIFQFAGAKLKNVEKRKYIGDKSDPFFVLQKSMGVSEKDGNVEWSHVYISNVVKNKLSPVWKESFVEVGDLCSGNLDEPIRIVVFDWEKSGKHRLIGFSETSINGIISAHESGTEIELTDSKTGVSGHINVQHASIIGFIDPAELDQRAEELAEKAKNARFFAKGAEQKAKIKGRRAEAAETAAVHVEEAAASATEEADAAMRLVLEKTVSVRLEELGFDL